jgi:hypothetical protein
MAKRAPKLDQVIDGTRVRVYATRTEYEVIFGDDDIAAPDAGILRYPKLGYPEMWARQGLLERHTLDKP